MAAVRETVDRVRSIEAEAYKYGFVSDIESDKAPKGLNEDVVRFISAKKGEPQWLLDWRLDAYRRWLTMIPPRWARVEFPEIDFQDLYYYSAPKSSAGPKSLDEVAPELLRTAKIELPPTAPFGAQVAFRARLAGLSQTAAASACSRLSAHGTACITVPPSGTSF